MIHQVIQPSGVLKKYIRPYHLMGTDIPVDFSPKNRIYTYGCIALVFHYWHTPLFQKRNELPYVEPQTVLCGQQTYYYDLALSGKTGMIFILYHPFGAGIFLKMPMNEIQNQNIENYQAVCAKLCLNVLGRR